MTKINQLSQSLTHVPDVQLKQPVPWFESERPHTLIILVTAESDCTSVTRRICSLAKETDSCIQLLGLYRNPGEELALRRELATAAALIRDARVYVEIVVEKGNNWMEAVRHSYQAGDMIVCLTEQSLGMRRKPLSQLLESNFKAPVYVFSKGSTEQPKSAWLAKVTAWSSLVGVIGFFFFLQVRIVQVATGGLQTILLILVLIPEIWLVKALNSLFF